MFFTSHTKSQKLSGVTTVNVDSGYEEEKSDGADGSLLGFHLNSNALILPSSNSIRSISFWLCVRQKYNWA